VNLELVFFASDYIVNGERSWPNPSFQRTRKQRRFACRLRAAEF
jgi:hypothetical protein